MGDETDRQDDAPRSAPGMSGAENAGERTEQEQREGGFVNGEQDGPYGGPGGDAQQDQEAGTRRTDAGNA
jgi:hypothetical protein